MTYASQSPRRAVRAAGFTLIEILVVVVIMGIASAAILPHIGNSDDSKAISAARAILADVMYAQNQAITWRRTHYVRFTPDAERYEVLQSIAPDSLITHPIDLTPFVMTFGPAGRETMRDVTIETVDLDGKTTLAFDELGVPLAYDPLTASTAPLTAGSIVVKCKAYQFTLTIEPFSGEIRIQ